MNIEEEMRHIHQRAIDHAEVLDKLNLPREYFFCASCYTSGAITVANILMGGQSWCEECFRQTPYYKIENSTLTN